MAESEREELRILTAAAKGRLHRNRSWRWVIDGEARPDRRVRERLMKAGCFTFRPWPGGEAVWQVMAVLTDRGRERLRALIPDDAPLAQEVAAYERGRRDAVREIVERLRWDADVAASAPGRFGELSARLGACADWIEREFGGAGSKRVPSTSKDLESGAAPTTGREANDGR